MPIEVSNVPSLEVHSVPVNGTQDRDSGVGAAFSLRVCTPCVRRDKQEAQQCANHAKRTMVHDPFSRERWAQLIVYSQPHPGLSVYSRFFDFTWTSALQGLR